MRLSDWYSKGGFSKGGEKLISRSILAVLLVPEGRQITTSVVLRLASALSPSAPSWLGTSDLLAGDTGPAADGGARSALLEH